MADVEGSLAEGEGEARSGRPVLVRLLWAGSLAILVAEAVLVGVDRITLVAGLALIPAALSALIYLMTRWAVRRPALLIAAVNFGVSVLVLMVVIATLAAIGGAQRGS